MPLPGGGLTWVEAYTETLFGKVSARWEIRDGFFELTVGVPKGTTCEMTIPDGTSRTLSDGTHTMRCVYNGDEIIYYLI